MEKYLHRINYFGKRGCFFQFISYKETPNEANVKVFDIANWLVGILQQYDDILEDAEFKHVDNYNTAHSMREQKVYLIPLKNKSSSKSYTPKILFRRLSISV